MPKVPRRPIAQLRPEWPRGRRTVLGDRLRELREKRGLSQADFGMRAGLLRSYVSRIENGHILPDLDLLEKMTTALGVPLYTLFLTDRQFLVKVTQGMGPARRRSNGDKRSTNRKKPPDAPNRGLSLV